ncbi:MAG: T9SS type A sorting domain-containing protein [bacterium]|nr:T9SS type A sorting domain-containing protein [bacterium]
MKKFVFLICFLVLSSGFSDAQDRLYVVQYGDESLAEIRLATGIVNSHVLDLGYGCNDIVVSDHRLLVTNSLLNTVQMIDAETNATFGDFPTAGGVNPYSLAVVNQDTVAVTNWISNNILLMRLTDGSVVGNVSVGVAPQGILAHEDRVFVCLTRYQSFGVYGPGVVMVYSRPGFQWLDSLQVGMNPQTAAVDDQNRLHVVCTGNYANIAGEIYVIDLDAPENHAIVPIGGSPMNLSCGGGQVVIAAGGWGGHGEVYRYRLSDLAMLNSSTSPIFVGVGATDVEALSDGSFFVSCSMDDAVEYRDSNGALLQRYLVSDAPGQMVLYASPNETNPGHQTIVASSLSIEEAYPNPFNSTVHFRLSNVSRTTENIRIFNEMGQFVDNIEIPPGMGESVWNPANHGVNIISSGMYLAVLGADGGGKATRILFVK